MSNVAGGTCAELIAEQKKAVEELKTAEFKVNERAANFTAFGQPAHEKDVDFGMWQNYLLSFII